MKGHATLARHCRGKAAMSFFFLMSEVFCFFFVKKINKIGAFLLRCPNALSSITSQRHLQRTTVNNVDTPEVTFGRLTAARIFSVRSILVNKSTSVQ